MSRLSLALFSAVSLVLTLAGSSSHASRIVRNFTVFENRTEAANYVETFEKNVYAVQLNRSPRSIVPLDDPKYAFVQGIIGRIWAGYQQVYPEYTKGLPQPEFVIINDPAVNAYAFSDSDHGVFPWVFIVQTGLLASANDAEAKGVMAHEFGHLVLRHLFPGLQKRITKYYYVGTAGEPLGFTKQDDPAVHAAAERATELMSQVGSFYPKELTGIPFDVFGRAPYFNLLIKLLTQSLANGEPSCTTAARTLNELSTEVVSRYDAFTNSFRTVEFGDPKLAQLGQNFISLLRLCFTHDRRSLRDVLKDAFAMDEEAINRNIQDGQIPGPDFPLFDRQPTVFDGIFAVVSAKQAELRAIDSRINHGRLRAYTFEEAADDASVRVLRQVGEDPRGGASFFARILPEADSKKCLAEIKAGIVPAYGGLFDAHHTTCYRIYHIGKLIEFLDQSETRRRAR